MKATLVTIIVTISLTVNGIFVYNRLENEIYKKGVQQGVKAISNQIIEEVVKNKGLTVNTPNGKVLLTVVEARRNSPMPFPMAPPVKPSVPDVNESK